MSSTKLPALEDIPVESVIKMTSIEGLRLALPEPYLTRYQVLPRSASTTFQIAPEKATTKKPSAPTLTLHNQDLCFTDLTKGEDIKANNNTQWARARRSPSITLQWTTSTPTINQTWLITYAIFSCYSEIEQFRLLFKGPDPSKLRQDLLSVGLAIRHPVALIPSSNSNDEIIILRSAFWQGAGSPAGPRPIWVPACQPLETTSLDLSNYPPQPLIHTITNHFPTSPIYSRHPLRAAKPHPGSTVYSRYIPHLGEHYSMVALDYENEDHLQLFHTWQNDPRVAKGWNETGDLEHHRGYLKRMHDDPHIVTLLGAFDGTFFAYFEIYWGKEDTLGVHYPSSDYDRGRHALVGNAAFRGPARATAWISSLCHYIFLDDPRTMYVIGEPKATNSRILSYDLALGAAIDGWVDFGHKRSGMVRIKRERYFEMANFGWNAEDERGVDGAEQLLKYSRGSKL